MKGLIKLFVKDIKSENFTRKEIIMANVVTLVMVVVAVIGGSLLS